MRPEHLNRRGPDRRDVRRPHLAHHRLQLHPQDGENGFDALRMLPRSEYDLILTDINMPDINGLELVSFVKQDERYAGIPLVIVSTEGSERDRDKGLELGADAYLVKPFEPAQLRTLVLDLLGGRE